MVPNCNCEHEVWQYIITMEAAPEIMHIFCSWLKFSTYENIPQVLKLVFGDQQFVATSF